jgi:hypothetical protein
MPHITSGPTLDASGVLASRLLDFLANKRPLAQERLGDRRLDEARDLAQKNGDWISPSDLKIAKDKVLQCVPSSKCVSELCSTPCQRGGNQGRVGIQKVAFRNSYKRGNTESLPKRLSVLSRSLLRITLHRKQHFSQFVNYRPFQTELRDEVLGQRPLGLNPMLS